MILYPLIKFHSSMITPAFWVYSIAMFIFILNKYSRRLSSDFGFSNVHSFKRVSFYLSILHMSIWTPNFDETSQFTAETFSVLENKRPHIEILLPVLILTYLSSSACHFASAYQISSKSNHRRWSYMYDVISIFQNGGHRIANLLPASGLMTALIWEGQNMFAE